MSSSAASRRAETPPRHFAIAERHGHVDKSGRRGHRSLFGAPLIISQQGGPFLSTAPEIDRLMATGAQGMALLPSGRARIRQGDLARCRWTAGQEARRSDPAERRLASPQPVWVENGKFFAQLVGLGLLPAGYEGNLDKLQAAQDAAIAALAPATAQEVPDRGCKQAGALQQRQDVRRRSRALRRRSLRPDGWRQDRLGWRHRSSEAAGRDPHDRWRRQDVGPGLVGQPHACRRRFPDGQ